MGWFYKGEELLDENIPPKAEGFLYIMTYIPTGQRYIGRKLLTKAHRRQKDKKIIKSRVESDWRDYWSSSPEINSIIEKEGNSCFTREILIFAFTKGQLNYLEEKFLYSLSVLESTDWLNSNIRSKVYKRNILNKINTEEISLVLSSLQ
jgi:Putative endonuclease segE, GIY-YIG domain